MEETSINSQQSGSFPRKRPRPVLSCLACRQKKLKCDRQEPCQQCIVAGRRAECSYLSHPKPTASSQEREPPDLEVSEPPSQATRLEVPSGSTAGGFRSSSSSTRTLPHHVPRGVVEDLQERVKKLEQHLAHRSGLASIAQSNGARNSGAGRFASNPRVDRGSVRMKGSRSRYYSSGHAVALLDQFDEVRLLMQQSSQHPDSKILRNQFKILQKELPKRYKTNQWSINNSAVVGMRNVLPQRSVCDKLVAIYIDNFESTFRILHIPSFLSACEVFWANQEENLITTLHFLPQLLAVLCVAAPLDDSNSLVHDSAATRVTILRWLDLLETWLTTLSRKKGLDFTVLQTQCLCILARQVCLVKQDELWNATGSLVRSAITIGLHRDTANTSGISMFETELRRRLWYSIVELDLQASMAEGVPSMVKSEHFDTFVPANVNDSELSESMIEPPPAKEPYEWTDSLCQVVLARSLVLRLDASNVLWDVQHNLTYDESFRLAKDLEKLNEDIPPILKGDNTTDYNQEGLEVLLHRATLDILLRRVPTSIQRHLVTQSQSQQDHPERLANSRKACVNSALALLSHLDVIETHASDPVSKPYRDLFWALFKHDVLEAAITVCLELKATITAATNEPSPSSTSTLPLKRRYEQYASSNQTSPTISDPSTTSRRAHLIRKVETTIQYLFARVDELESNIKDPLVLSLVLESVRVDEPREQKQTRMREGIRRVIEAGRKKKTVLSQNAKTGEEMNGGGGNGTVTVSGGAWDGVGIARSDAATFDPLDQIPAFDMDLDYSGFAHFGLDWTFDQFWP